MATLNVTATAQTLTENDPYAVVDLAFTYAGTTVQHGTAVYFGAHLTDGTHSEDALFPVTVTSGDNIPQSGNFSYTSTAGFNAPISVTANSGKVYYTA